MRPRRRRSWTPTIQRRARCSRAGSSAPAGTSPGPSRSSPDPAWPRSAPRSSSSASARSCWWAGRMRLAQSSTASRTLPAELADGLRVLAVRAAALAEADAELDRACAGAGCTGESGCAAACAEALDRSLSPDPRAAAPPPRRHGHRLPPRAPRPRAGRHREGRLAPRPRRPLPDRSQRAGPRARARLLAAGRRAEGRPAPAQDAAARRALRAQPRGAGGRAGRWRPRHRGAGLLDGLLADRPTQPSLLAEAGEAFLALGSRPRPASSSSRP